MYNEYIMNIYRKKIFALAEEPKAKIFFNSRLEHSLVVHTAIVKYSKEHIYILCRSFCDDIIVENKEYLIYMDSFLSNPKRKVKILFSDYKEEFKEKKLYKIFKAHKNQVEMKKTNCKFFKDNKEINFTVSDGRTFRFELNAEKKIAVGNFNNEKQAKKLEDFFLETFNSEKSNNIYWN